MNIAFFPNMTKKAPKDIASKVVNFLKERNVHVYSEDAIAEEIGSLALTTIDPKKIDYMVCMGGDGTILRLVHRHPELTAPLMAINCGGLGFMADIPFENIFQGLENLLQNKVTINKRIMMEGMTMQKQFCVAVNDIVFHRAKNPSLIELSIYVDDVYLNTFSADGIIVSTPSGSTAYSLAAGGPILTPDLNAFVITPICPHTISNRPIVLMPKKEIRVEYISHLDPVEITYDGFSSFQMKTGEHFTITLSPKKFSLVSLLEHDFYTTLRTKLGWSGMLKTYTAR